MAYVNIDVPASKMSTNETLWANRTLGMLARMNRIRIVPVWTLQADGTYRLMISNGARATSTTIDVGDLRSAFQGDQALQTVLIRTLRELVERLHGTTSSIS